uniref:FAD-dependent oxidoreductase n=1 Tax=uncultured Microbacterium sp. TaxID=191216 RepID=UPI002611C1F1
MSSLPAPADTADLVVVGSGIVGLGAAYAAVRRGLRVIVVDRTDARVGATVRNFGHLCIGAQTGRARGFADASREIWMRLAADAGFWLRPSGTLIAAQHADELAVLERASVGTDMRMLSVEALRQRAPLRAGSIVGGALLASDMQVNPRTAASAIARHLSDMGVEFRFRTAATAVSG